MAQQDDCANLSPAVAAALPGAAAAVLVVVVEAVVQAVLGGGGRRAQVRRDSRPHGGRGEAGADPGRQEGRTPLPQDGQKADWSQVIRTRGDRPRRNFGKRVEEQYNALVKRKIHHNCKKSHF